MIKKKTKNTRQAKRSRVQKRVIQPYGFLYYLNEKYDEGNEKFKSIIAKSIDSACKKFMRLAPESLTRIDYEVSFGRDFIDISKNKYINQRIVF